MHYTDNFILIIVYFAENDHDGNKMRAKRVTQYQGPIKYIKIDIIALICNNFNSCLTLTSSTYLHTSPAINYIQII